MITFVVPLHDFLLKQTVEGILSKTSASWVFITSSEETTNFARSIPRATVIITENTCLREAWNLGGVYAAMKTDSDLIGFVHGNFDFKSNLVESPGEFYVSAEGDDVKESPCVIVPRRAIKKILPIPKSITQRFCDTYLIEKLLSEKYKCLSTSWASGVNFVEPVKPKKITMI